MEALLLVVMLYDAAHAVEGRACRDSILEHCPEAIVYRLQPERYRPREDGRSWVGHCWSLKPVAVQLALRAYPDEPFAYYVDSDFLFFDSIARVPFPEDLDLMVVRAGEPSSVNSGFVGFRNNPNGRAIARWWGRRCWEWCENAVGPKGIYTDEGYLGYLLDRGLPATRRVGLCPDWNVGLAPWSMLGRVRLVDGVLYHAGRPVPCFHFQGYDNIPVRPSVREVLYPIYQAALDAAAKEVSCVRHS